MTKSIAFFDVDYTLWGGNSGYYTTLRLVRHKILKKRHLLFAAYYQLTSIILRHDVQKIYGLAIGDMAGSTLSRIFEIGRECFEKDMRPLFFPDAIECVRKHQTEGDPVVLLTSGPYMTMKFLKDYLRADDAYCMGPEVVDGILINKLQLPICYGEGKIHFAKEACKKFGVSLSNCYFYTDHHLDLPLLDLIGHPQPVNPSRKLEKIAKSRGWPVLRFRR